jgi:hypothetical protein
VGTLHLSNRGRATGKAGHASLDALRHLNATLARENERARDRHASEKMDKITGEIIG